MARKRRVTSPAPPPPPPQQSASSEEDKEEGSDPEAEAQASQMRPGSGFPTKAAAAPPQSESDADEEEEKGEEDGDADGSEPEVPEPVKKKAAATNKSKTAELQKKKRPAPEPAPSGKAKKAKAAKGTKANAQLEEVAAVQSDANEEEEKEEEDGDSDGSEPEVPEPVKKKAAATNKSKTVELQKKKRPAPEPAPSGKVRKAKAETAKVPREATPAAQGMKANAELEKVAAVQTRSGKANKPGGKLETPVAKSRAHWTKEDVMKILEALAEHVKRDGVLPPTDLLFSALRDNLDRENCTYTDVYEKVRGLRKRFFQIVGKGVVPSGGDELQKHNLSDAIWGEKAKEAIAAVAASRQKGQSERDKVGGNSKGGTSKEAAIATENGGALVKRKRGKMDKVMMDTQNGGTQTDEETPQETEKGARSQGTPRSFEELQKLYPNLASSVERIAAQHSCGETLKRLFQHLAYDKAIELESKIKLQRLSDVKGQIRAAKVKNGIINKLIGLVD